MTPRERYIADIRAFRETKERGEREVDRKTLDVAAELVALYENRTLDGTPFEGERWQDECEPIKPTRRRARPEDPNAWSRFSKWAEGRVGLKASQLRRLRNADEMAAFIRPGANKSAEPVSEKSLRPLRWFVTQERTAAITEVWADAVKLAGGVAPSETDVRAAVRAWKDRNIPKPDKPTTEPQSGGKRQKMVRLKAQCQALLREDPVLFAEMFAELHAELREVAKPRRLEAVA